MNLRCVQPHDAAAALNSMIGVVAFLLGVAEHGSPDDLTKAVQIAQIAVERYGLTLG